MVIFKKNIYIQNGIFQKFLKSKFDPNILQNRAKLHHFKNIFGLACPRTPLAKRMALPCAACRFATCKFPNLKINSCPPPKSREVLSGGGGLSLFLMSFVVEKEV